VYGIREAKGWKRASVALPRPARRCTFSGSP
jgi:hypothetical protein